MFGSAIASLLIGFLLLNSLSLLVFGELIGFSLCFSAYFFEFFLLVFFSFLGLEIKRQNEVGFMVVFAFLAIPTVPIFFWFALITS